MTQRTLRDVLQYEKEHHLSGGIYHHIQINLTYNSNHIEGSRLTHDQTRYIFETNTIGMDKETSVNVDDIIETTNHFRCIDAIIDRLQEPLTSACIKQLHRILKTGTSDSRNDWFAVGEYKTLPNEVGGRETTAPEDVPMAMETLITAYEQKGNITLEDIVAFHVQFESIHPFQDGNGRVGRLIMFKECLRHNVVPFIISDDLKFFYYRGLHEWKQEQGYLIDTCRTGQDRFAQVLDYFRIDHA